MELVVGLSSGIEIYKLNSYITKPSLLTQGSLTTRLPPRGRTAWGRGGWRRWHTRRGTHRSQNTCRGRCRPCPGLRNKTGRQTGTGSCILCSPCTGPNLPDRRTPRGRSWERRAFQYSPCTPRSHGRSCTCRPHRA